MTDIPRRPNLRDVDGPYRAAIAELVHILVQYQRAAFSDTRPLSPTVLTTDPVGAAEIDRLARENRSLTVALALEEERRLACECEISRAKRERLESGLALLREQNKLTSTVLQLNEQRPTDAQIKPYDPGFSTWC